VYDEFIETKHKGIRQWKMNQTEAWTSHLEMLVLSETGLGNHRLKKMLKRKQQQKTKKETEMKKPPKYISKNEAIAFYTPGEAQSSDYRHYVELKEGWVFKFYNAHPSEYRRFLFFDNKSDFDFAGLSKA